MSDEVEMANGKINVSVSMDMPLAALVKEHGFKNRRNISDTICFAMETFLFGEKAKDREFVEKIYEDVDISKV